MTTSAANDSTSCCSLSAFPYVSMARPMTASPTLRNMPAAAAAASRDVSGGAAADGGARISSRSRVAAGISARSPLTARLTSMPGMSSRLISLVPSKMRFTRESR